MPCYEHGWLHSAEDCPVCRINNPSQEKVTEAQELAERTWQWACVVHRLIDQNTCPNCYSTFLKVEWQKYYRGFWRWKRVSGAYRNKAECPHCGLTAFLKQAPYGEIGNSWILHIKTKNEAD